MKCSNCGAEVREGVPFCSECGRPLQSGAKPPKQKRAKGTADASDKPKRKIKWRLVAFCAILVLLLGAAGFAYLRLPAFRMQRALDDADASGYRSAAKIYTAEVSKSGFENWLSTLLCRDDMGDAAKAYFAGDLSYDEAKAFYAAFLDKGSRRLSKEAEKQLDAIETDHAARKILAEGDAAVKDNDLIAAMEAYDRVPESSVVYKQAQEKRTAAQKQYVTDISDSVDKLVGSGSYAKAMTTLNDALKVLPDDEALQTKRATVGAAFEAITLDAISEDVNREDYAAAIKALQEALKVMPDSTKLSDRLDELKDLQKEQEKEVKSI